MDRALDYIIQMFWFESNLLQSNNSEVNDDVAERNKSSHEGRRNEHFSATFNKNGWEEPTWSP